MIGNETISKGAAKDAPHPTAPTRRVLSAGTLAGDHVRNRAGDDLGTVEEIMIDLESGQIAYVVLSFGGFLGIGDKLFAVPWESLELNAADHEFILDVDKQTLENAPGFDKDNWPDMADPKWGSEVHAHYGREPYWNRTDEWRKSSNAARDFGTTNAEVSSTESPRTYSAGSTSGTKREI